MHGIQGNIYCNSTSTCKAWLSMPGSDQDTDSIAPCCTTTYQCNELLWAGSTFANSSATYDDVALLAPIQGISRKHASI